MIGPEDYFGAYEIEVASLDSLQQRYEQVEALAAASGLRFYWRGQADAAWGVHSTLHRGVAASKQADVHEVKELDVVRAETAIVAEARPWIRPSVGARLATVDLLARLQHHGVPTRLVDFTRDPRVAAYFACTKEPDRDGRLLVAAARTAPSDALLNAFDIPWRPGSPSRPSDWSTSLTELADHADFPRIIHQEGAFVVGGTPSTVPQRRSGDGSSLLAADVRRCMSIPLALHRWSQAEHALAGQPTQGRNPTVASALTIRIPADAKPPLRAALEHAGVRFAGLFPDSEGLLEWSDVVRDYLAGDGAGGDQV